jgi:hypothetical protein
MYPGTPDDYFILAADKNFACIFNCCMRVTCRTHHLLSFYATNSIFLTSANYDPVHCVISSLCPSWVHIFFSAHYPYNMHCSHTVGIIMKKRCVYFSVCYSLPPCHVCFVSLGAWDCGILQLLTTQMR